MAIPEFLRQAVLEEVIKTTPVPEEFYFSNRFGSRDSPDAWIRWMIQHGDKGMAPIINRGAQSPRWAGGGFSEMVARGALISEKKGHDEADVNRAMSKDPLIKQATETILLSDLEDLLYRNRLRREWMCSQPVCNVGIVDYRDDFGVEFRLNYNLPPDLHTVLTGNDVWKTGSSRDPLGDCLDMKRRVLRRCGGEVTKALINSKTMDEKIASDPQLQELLKKQNFGGPGSEGILKTQATELLTWLFNTPFEVYDNEYPVTLGISQRIDAKNYVVNNASIVTAGSEVTLQRVDTNQERQEELHKVDSVDIPDSTITLVDNASGMFIAGRDQIQCQVPFLKDNRIVFIAEKVRGKDILLWYNSPVGLGTTRFGLRMETWENKEPDEIISRAQNLGLWALLFNGAIGTLDIG